MKEKELRRHLAVFPMSSVRKLTDLSDRQIRYYEEHGLVKPERNEGNRRLFSLNDMDRLLEIKDLLAEGYSIAEIKKNFYQREQKSRQKMSEKAVRRALHRDIVREGPFQSGPSQFGSLGPNHF
ncbi:MULTISPECIES: MerR family transcriptional regulator [unclassified Streptococcus]|uniref:MerR family transcriptional regulator n=1 Tax=unclassified Streptococcus TaxID=2608887 RepID=UPI0018A964E0|nr:MULTISPECIES: MerR family transcriptional regulator [unclassified Streptococcus]MBF8970754.1 MerR family transcriptional regulator [Streptococcus sp. NLN76]MBG9367078.1 MerR family transcriptional regulator [Streptococcus sp. NLN64]MBJ6746467.1 MerR family transcriptional regulator [Streptococcus sp. 121]